MRLSKRPRLLFPEPKPTVCPSDDELNILADVLNRSKKITILGGAGCAGAHDELIELAGKLQAPIVHALRGKEFIEYDNPFDVGMTGLLGFSSGYHAMMNCDTLLMIGTDFPYRQFFPKDATIVQIDLRGEQLGRRSKVDFGFVGDTKTTLRALLPRLEQNQYEAHLKESLEHYRNARQGLDELASGGFRQETDPSTICRARARSTRGRRRDLHLRRRNADDLGCALSHDEWQAPAARFLHPRIDGQRIAPGHRRAGQPSRPPGDLDVGRWRFRDAHGRLLTLRQHDLPVKLIVFQKRFAGVCRAGNEGGRHS